MPANDTHGGRTTTTSNGIGHIAPDGSAPAVLLLTPAQASRSLAISRRKLWAMTANGEIPHIRVGRCVRYPIDALREWLTDRTTKRDS